MKVRFVRDDAPWHAGDVEDFAPEVAEKLVRHEVAEYLEAPPAPAKKGKKG